MDVNNAATLVAPLTAAQEGFEPSPYLDAGSYAIGYGNHFYADGSPVGQDDAPISQADAYDLLTTTLAQTAAEVAGLLQVQVSDNLLAGLTDLTYNWGIGNFSKSQVLKLINSGADPGTISAQWQQTAVTSEGQPSNTLVARRAAEVSLAFGTAESLPVGPLLIVAAVILAVLFLKK